MSSFSLSLCVYMIVYKFSKSSANWLPAWVKVSPLKPVYLLVKRLVLWKFVEILLDFVIGKSMQEPVQ